MVKAVDNERAVLVVGSGRSGTSLMAMSLKALGGHIPPPEIPANDTNPSGFGESRWLINFHSPILRRHGVMLTDARPESPQRIRESGFSTEERERALEWINESLTHAPTIVLKDPRLTWFIDEWKSVLDELGIETAAIHMVRHPLEVVASKYRWYDPKRSRTSDFILGSWINAVRLVDSSTVAGLAFPVLHRDLISEPLKTIETVVGKRLPCLAPGLSANLGDRLQQLLQKDRSHSHPGLLDAEDPVSPILANISERIFNSLVKENRGEISPATALLIRRESFAEYDSVYRDSERIVHKNQKFREGVAQQEIELAKALKQPDRFLAGTILRRARSLLGQLAKALSARSGNKPGDSRGD